jgi:hypothetical protein
MISVSVIKPDEALGLPWDELRPFARNVFMNPIALKAATDTMLAAIYVLVAWDMSVEPARLVGLWALQLKHLAFWPILETLPFNYAFLSTPVMHPDYADDIVPAFLAAAAKDKRLPPVVVARDLDASGREHSALHAAIKDHPQAFLRQVQRPIATREVGIKRSGSTRKKLRQTWNRLAAEGLVAVENVRDPRRAGEALEAFLTLERAGWKGRKGTALLNDRRDADFARRLIADMAVAGQASVAVLTLDGRPIATQVVFYCGRIAFTWKTSFDPGFARFSPGTLLIDRLASDLIDGGEVDLIDSCADDDGFMGQLLAGRKPMADVVFSVTRRASLGFRVIGGYLALRVKLKTWRDRRRAPPAAPEPASGAKAPPVAQAPREASSPGPTIDRAA